jgi:uncharacterized SAM-binding protein YcdF (DUF218 family)
MLSMTEIARRAHSNRRLVPLLFATFVLILFIAWAARTSILRESAVLWTVSDPLERADAIAVLGGGVDLRPFLAADLYKKGLAHKILVANVKLSPIEKLGIVPRHTDLNREVLLKLGVPQEAIVGFGSDVSSTFDESRALAVWAKDTRAHTIIVPTELFPSRRQRWILNYELGPIGARAIIDAHKPLEYDIDDWWQHEEGLIDFQNEVIKYLYYRLRY